jgi:hypothetical protein
MSRRKTNEQFIEEATNAHSGRYSYSMCGEFKQSAGNHLTLKQGCPSCGGTKKLTTDDFKNKSSVVHNGKYSYDKTKYTSNKKKVIITCTEHGDFIQTASDHLSGYGCPSCGGVLKYDTPTFIARAEHIHGGVYNYTKSNYVNKDTKVIITCTEHGDFNQTPHNHCQNKQGCPSCTRYGYDNNKKGSIYFLVSEGGEYLKVGITNNIKNRMSQLMKLTPFGFSCVHIANFDGTLCPSIESAIHGSFVSAELRGFNGATEWFIYDADKTYFVMSLINN